MNNLSPPNISTGQKIDFDTHCQIDISQYDQNHEQHENYMFSIKNGVNYMSPTGNKQTGY